MKRIVCGRSGFSLIEVALSIGVASFCLIAVFGLLPIGIKSNRTSTSETTAAGILVNVDLDLRATPPTTPIRGGSTTSLEYQIPIPANPVTGSISNPPLYFNQEGQVSTSSLSQSRYRLTLTYLANNTGSSGARTATRAHIRITWPAAADPSIAEGSLESFASFDRN